jgi:lysozyme
MREKKMAQVTSELIAALKHDEGRRLAAYRDTLGVWTIGYGHTGDDVTPDLVWMPERAERQLIDDVQLRCDMLEQSAPYVNNLSPVRLRVLQNMAFNLGVNGLLRFRQTLDYIKRDMCISASKEMLNSVWAKQVGDRADRLSAQMFYDKEMPLDGTWQAYVDKLKRNGTILS